MTSTFPTISISTERLVLRPLDEDDVPALADMMNDEQVAAWTAVPQPYDEAAARRWITEYAPTERTEGRGLDLAVTEFLTQRLVGVIQLRQDQLARPLHRTVVHHRALGARRGLRLRGGAGHRPMAGPRPEVRAHRAAHGRRQHRLPAGRAEDRLYQRGSAARRLHSARPGRGRQVERGAHRLHRVEPPPGGPGGPRGALRGERRLHVVHRLELTPAPVPPPLP